MSKKELPEPERYYEANAENGEILREILEQLRQNDIIRKILTYENMAKIAGITTEQIGHYIRGEKTSKVLDPEPHKRLVNYIWDRHWWNDKWIIDAIGDHPDAFFHAFNSFFKTGSHTVRNLHSQALGVYSLFRRSLHAPGEFIVGTLEIYAEPRQSAIKIRETQKYERPNQYEQPQTEIFEGYLTKKSRYLVLTAKQSGLHKGAPRITMIHNTTYDADEISTMEGVVTGCQGSNKLFSTPVYMERIKDLDAFKDKIGVVDELPHSIMGKLSFNIVDNIIRY